MSGLRERKKQATRIAIRDAAMRLFAEQGFTATTIDQIANAATVSRATVFGYFATKEDIVFGDAPSAVPALEAALAERPEGVGTAAAFRDWLLGLAELGGWIEPELVLQLQLADEVPTVRAHRLALHRDFERVVAEALQAELGPDQRLAAALAAAALMAAVSTAEETAARRMRDERRELAPAEFAELLGEAVTFAEAGIAAVRRR
ncbi:TetR/AcrR family transcriptional regulator [Solirubrobacter phytolaccae]|uniref:TetR/AcrR family transcriptional regulator n=1 Tax=Solirubrobacter phytolaccae TaxID=1404360 RepID=A0A9X3S842_9ACTN|nr:TetR/AcrR family transcriptional regulator [Solirubrobacter phytolaccae]MDA0179856.1 TetR/AcrR family transcriptional regulator [Solirubrobacter phytolaccae]